MSKPSHLQLVPRLDLPFQSAGQMPIKSFVSPHLKGDGKQRADFMWMRGHNLKLASHAVLATCLKQVVGTPGLSEDLILHVMGPLVRGHTHVAEGEKLGEQYFTKLRMYAIECARTSVGKNQVVAEIAILSCTCEVVWPDILSQVATLVMLQRDGDRAQLQKTLEAEIARNIMGQQPEKPLDLALPSKPRGLSGFVQRVRGWSSDRSER